jgi:hypothetical protein
VLRLISVLEMVIVHTVSLKLKPEITDFCSRKVLGLGDRNGGLGCKIDFGEWHLKFIEV